MSSSREQIFNPENEQLTGQATFWQQLKATTIRNLKRKKRGNTQTFNVSVNYQIYRHFFTSSFCVKRVKNELLKGYLFFPKFKHFV